HVHGHHPLGLPRRREGQGRRRLVQGQPQGDRREPAEGDRQVTITGAHVLLYSPEADALRAVLGDTFGWKSVDAGGGWLIFALPPTEAAVHRSDRPNHELCLMCDDIDATVAELKDKGVEFKHEPREERWGT